MSEQATLFLLKDKLEKVRKERRNRKIAVIAVVIVQGLLWNAYYQFDFITGFILVVGFATFLSILIDKYYGKQEIAILRQIEKMSRGNGY